MNTPTKKTALKTQTRYLLLLVMSAVAVFILTRNSLGEKDLNHVNRAFEEMYKDRLVAESYIYRMNDLLYKSRIGIMEQGDRAGVRRIFSEIETLIALYSRTRLTENENLQFSAFRRQFHALKVHAFLASGAEASRRDMIARTDAAILALRPLSEIQLKEGEELRSNSAATLSSGFLVWRLEWILLVAMLLLVAAFVKDRILPPAALKAPQLN